MVKSADFKFDLIDVGSSPTWRQWSETSHGLLAGVLDYFSRVLPFSPYSVSEFSR